MERKSCFLFGPRQTGKSTLIRQQFADCPVWNLLDQRVFLRLARNPALIRESLPDRRETAIVVIDEIQRMPALLNEVHLLGDRFDLDRALEHGLLPSIFFSESPAEDLAAYAGDYLLEEVAAEAIVGNIGAFSRFLQVAALAHGEMIKSPTWPATRRCPLRRSASTTRS